jgi:hypothetical protein
MIKPLLVEDDLNMKEPVNMKRYLFMTWALAGAYIFYRDFKKYYEKMSKPLSGIDYSQSFWTLIKE